MTEPCEFCDSEENVRLIPFRSVLTFMCEKCVNESLNKARDGVTPNENNMNTFKERLIVEKSELDDKLGKLKAFMESDKFNGIATVQRSLLQVQSHAMLTYSQILFERIKWLEMLENPKESA